LRQAYIEIYGAIRSDGALVGFLAAMEHGIGSAPLIEYICVDSAARNGGVGTGLIGHFEDALYPEARNLYLFVSDINPHAQRLYLRLGYLPAGALSNYNYEMQTEFLFRKTRGPKQSGPLPNASSAMSEAS
jgi:ribosomal protein S18 acetylase RimI-like enzyme